MGASVQKLSNFKRSAGLVNDFSNYCEPCLTNGQHVQEHGFCVDCNEYLCKNCLICHQKALIHHQLLYKHHIAKHGIHTAQHTDLCTEKCAEHKDEVIKYFCQQHEKFGCHKCMTLDHGTCDLDYIPDEYASTIWLMNQKMKEVEAVQQKATETRKKKDTHNQDLIKEINSFQTGLVYCSQEICNEIQADIFKQVSSDKQTVKGVLDFCKAISSDISHLQSSLKDSKTKKQNIQLYITIKKAKSKLMTYQIEKIEKELMNIQSDFEPNQDMLEKLSKQDATEKPSLPKKQVPINKKLCTLIPKFNINTKTKTDMLTCDITGCTVLSSHKLVVADYGNTKLKVLDIHRNQVVEEKKLDSKPWDITTLPEDKIAVTLPDKEEIHIMTTEGKISIVHIILVKGKCRGLTYHQDYLFVVCYDPLDVVILDTEGNVHNRISLNRGLFQNPQYIVVSEDSRVIYISESSSKNVAGITLQGEISEEYGNLPWPYGMVKLDDGSLLVCCRSLSGSIHHISGDLKEGRQLLCRLVLLQSICYNKNLQEVYIGGLDNQLKVFGWK